MPIRGAHVTITRDLAMFMLGAAIVANEAFIAHTDRPNVIYIGGALMGVAAYLRGVTISRQNGHRNGNGNGHGAA